jgi:hypothetical protein
MLRGGENFEWFVLLYKSTPAARLERGSQQWFPSDSSAGHIADRAHGILCRIRHSPSHLRMIEMPAPDEVIDLAENAHIT